MPLDDIKEVMLSKKVERLLPFLDQQKKVLEEEEKKIRHQIEMVDWYKDYFTYMERNEDAPCVMHLKERYYLQVPCYKRDLLADMEIRLAKEKSEQGIDNAMYLRQYGYKISYLSLFVHARSFVVPFLLLPGSFLEFLDYLARSIPVFAYVSYGIWHEA